MARKRYEDSINPELLDKLIKEPRWHTRRRILRAWQGKKGLAERTQAKAPIIEYNYNRSSTIVYGNTQQLISKHQW